MLAFLPFADLILEDVSDAGAKHHQLAALWRWPPRTSSAAGPAVGTHRAIAAPGVGVRAVRVPKIVMVIYD